MQTRLFGLIVAVATMFRALSAGPSGHAVIEDDEALQMEKIEVSATVPRRYGVITIGTAEMGRALVLKPVPAKRGFIVVLIGGARIGDEIVSVDGRPIADFGEASASQILTGRHTLMIKRRIGRSHKLIEVDCRRDAPS
jgi:RNase P/RNase MRP subunit p29